MELNCIELTKRWIGYNTVNPPGNERKFSLEVSEILTRLGFEVRNYKYGQNRSQLIAYLEGSNQASPWIFTGHFDTVPFGEAPWKREPLNAYEENDHLYGRGSSDMKSALASMICAASEVVRKGRPKRSLAFIFTCDEELGCYGAKSLRDELKWLLPGHALIVGEPTGNIPAAGHKGGLYLRADYKGKSAHSSMPHLGVNAIYEMSRDIIKLSKFKFKCSEDDILGFPTLNVGTANGGKNLNSVPDSASFTIDVRTTSKIAHKELLEELQGILPKATLETLVDLPAVTTDPSNEVLKKILQITELEYTGLAMSYLTDASELVTALDSIPTIILGPGEPHQAHQTDEYCLISKIEQAKILYQKIMESV